MCNEFDSNLNENSHSPRIFRCEYLVIEVGEDDGGQSPAVADDTGIVEVVPEPEDLLSLLEPIPSTGEEMVLPRLSDGELVNMKSLLDRFAAILFEYDPACINFAANTDEYDLEAEIIAAMLPDCRSFNDAMDAIIMAIREMLDTDLSPYRSNVKVARMSKQIWFEWWSYQYDNKG
jgi:hypothetical protein